MSESPRNPHPPPPYEEEEDEENPQEDNILGSQNRICDYCGDSIALLYCRADSAKLCFACDREVHSTNHLFSKHTRSLLCDACDSSPASIFCENEHSALCHNCDWEKRRLTLSLNHNRRPIEGFTGCPSVGELMAIVGIEDLGHKDLISMDENGGIDGLSDFLVCDYPCVVSIDDLIGATDASHDFQAMGVPTLPKNRYDACGQYKEEIIHQLRKLTKLEPNLDYENTGAEQNLLPKQDAQPIAFPTYEWSSDIAEDTNQAILPSSLLRSYFKESFLVPDQHSDPGGGGSHANDVHDEKTQHPVVAKTMSLLPKVGHELSSHDRDSAISRYKEKRKTRRYDKHVRYESRKVRAESRTRIKGRFAKVGQ